MLCAAVLATSAWVNDATAETYVILSLIGDHLTLLGLGAQTGSHLDQNPRQTVPVTGSGFDDFAVRVADAAIAKVSPSASVIALRAGDPNLYKMRDSWLDSDAVSVKELMSFLPNTVEHSSDAWLVLIIPYRDELELKTQNHRVGAGKVAGLGLYVDGMTWMRKSADEMNASRGFLGVFAHFQMMLINLSSGSTQGHERVVLGTTYAASRAEDRTPWNALTEAEKVRALQGLIKRGIEGALPGMLSSKKS